MFQCVFFFLFFAFFCSFSSLPLLLDMWEKFLVAPSTGWMLYYFCFTPSTDVGTPSAMGSAIVSPYLALSSIHMQVAVLNRLVPNRLGGSTAQ